MKCIYIIINLISYQRMTNNYKQYCNALRNINPTYSFIHFLHSIFNKAQINVRRDLILPDLMYY